jgi:hypothetical protein
MYKLFGLIKTHCAIFTSHSSQQFISSKAVISLMIVVTPFKCHLYKIDLIFISVISWMELMVQHYAATSKRMGNQKDSSVLTYKVCTNASHPHPHPHPTARHSDALSTQHRLASQQAESSYTRRRVGRL